MKIIKYILLIILILPSSCGYKAVNNIKSFNFIISEYEFKGDKKINYLLEKNFKRLGSNESSETDFKIISESKKNISVVTKDTKGEVSSYNIKVVVKIEIFKNKKLIDSVIFEKNTNYDNLNSKFELKQYENILLKDLVNDIIFKINNHMNTL